MAWGFTEWFIACIGIFFILVFIISGIVMWILWNRRKLSFCNFLASDGHWERQSYKREKLEKTFVYDGETYTYDIKKCTRDTLNRPIAHYYKGNPVQQQFDFSKTNKSIFINTEEITAKDFLVLIQSKVLRDIFQDEEVMNMLWIILIVVILVGVASIIFTVTHKPPCTLQADNETLSIIAQGVKQGIMR